MKAFRSLILTMFAALSFTMPAQAAQVERVELYPFIEYFTWSEYNEGERLLEETGPRGGFGVKADLDMKDRILVMRLRGDIHGGIVDYDGHTQTDPHLPEFSNRPVQTDVTYFGIRTEGDLGLRAFWTNGSVTPFLGLGYRWWIRSIQDSTGRSTTNELFKVNGYDELWQDLYLKAGARTVFTAGKTEFSVEGGAKIPIYTSNSINDVDYGWQTIKPNGRISGFAEAGINLGRFRPALYYEGFRYGKSPTVAVTPTLGILQPESRADIIGVNLYVTIR